MACTTLPISPESRKPLHTQVQNLREERINLLETVRALREDKDNLRVQLAAASRRISELDAKVDDGDMKRASLQDECNAIRQTSQMQEDSVRMEQWRREEICGNGPKLLLME
jgi:uncharacterized coiled-coil DUF342 family protein